MAGNHTGPTDLLDDAGDVIGVLTDSERTRSLMAAPSAPEVDGQDVSCTRKLVSERIPSPRIGGDAVDCDQCRRAVDSGPAERAEFGIADVEAQEFRSAPHVAAIRLGVRAGGRERARRGCCA